MSSRRRHIHIQQSANKPEAGVVKVAATDGACRRSQNYASNLPIAETCRCNGRCHQRGSGSQCNSRRTLRNTQSQATKKQPSKTGIPKSAMLSAKALPIPEARNTPPNIPPAPVIKITEQTGPNAPSMVFSNALAFSPRYCPIHTGHQTEISKASVLNRSFVQTAPSLRLR